MAQSNKNIYCLKCKNTQKQRKKQQKTGDICLRVNVVYVKKRKLNF